MARVGTGRHGGVNGVGGGAGVEDPGVDDCV